MAGYESTPKTLEEVRLVTGDKIRVTTRTDTIYDIEVGEAEAGLILSRIIRRPTDEAGLRLTEEVFEKAGIIGGYSVSMITSGKSMDVIGLNAETGERVVYRTTPVQTIAYVENFDLLDLETQLEAIDPARWQIERATSPEPKSPREAISRSAGRIASGADFSG